MRKLIWTADALDDLEDLYRYFADIDPDVAARIARAAGERAAMLLDQPFARQVADRAGRRRISVPRSRYQLIYRVIDTEVRILRLWRGARDQPAQ